MSDPALPPSIAESDLIELWEQLRSLRMQLERFGPTSANTRFEHRRLRAAQSRAVEALDAYHTAVEECLVERGVDPDDERFAS
jgi:hypothetical protein